MTTEKNSFFQENDRKDQINHGYEFIIKTTIGKCKKYFQSIQGHLIISWPHEWKKISQWIDQRPEVSQEILSILECYGKYEIIWASPGFHHENYFISG